MIGATTNIEGAYLSITSASELPGTATIVVTSIDSSEVNTYSIFFREISIDATLSNLSVEGETIEGFSSEVTQYEVVLPAGTVLIPVITAVTSDRNASRAITQAPQLPGEALVVVTAEDGETTLTYTINFTLMEDETSLPTLSPNMVSIFPNPIVSSLNIHLSNDLIGAEVKVISIIGRVVSHTLATERTVSIGMDNIPSGIYIVSIRKDEITISKRVTKR